VHRHQKLLSVGHFGILRVHENSSRPIHKWTIKQYELEKHVFNSHVHLELRRAVWGLPLAGILANKRLRRKLAPFRYHKCKITPGLWYHETRMITFTLVVDDFGVKYDNKSDVDHLIKSLKTNYALTEDILRNLTRVGLHQLDGRHLNAGIN
jgi:hypothetical protein